MNLSDYEAIWKRQPLPRGTAADLIDLKETFEAKRRNMERTILLRNGLEGFGGVLACLGYGLMTWRMGLAGWPITLGLLLILGVSGVFIYDWWRFRRGRLGPEAPMLAKLEGNIAELRHQRRLVEHMGKWYLIPYGTAFCLMIYGALPHMNIESLLTLLTTPSTAAWIAILLIVPLAATVWWWCDVQKGIRLRIDPRLDELEKLRRNLAGPTD